MMSHKISVIVPVYKSERFLHRCIESILNQTCKNIEIILIDDGSPDRCPEICDEYAKIDSRIKVVHQQNEGVSSARNKGMEMATGEFVTFVDSDDFIACNMYELLLSTALNENADIVQCGYHVTDEHGNILKTIRFHEEIIVGRYNSSYHYAKGINTTTFSVNKLYRYNILADIRFPLTIASEDFVLNVKAYYTCEKTVVIADALYYYVTNSESVCNKSFHLGMLDAVKNGKEMYKFHNERFSELCPFFALYVTEFSMLLYKNLSNSEINNKRPYLKALRNDFKYYYPLIKGNVFQLIKYSKRYLLILVFNISPRLYCWYYKRLRRR